MVYGILKRVALAHSLIEVIEGRDGSAILPVSSAPCLKRILREHSACRMAMVSLLVVVWLLMGAA